MTDEAQRTLGGLKADVAFIKEYILEDVKTLKARVTVLEEWRWKLVGILLAIGAIGGYVLTAVTPVVVKKVSP
jgi:hypothetical protein